MKSNCRGIAFNNFLLFVISDQNANARFHQRKVTGSAEFARFRTVSRHLNASCVTPGREHPQGNIEMNIRDIIHHCWCYLLHVKIFVQHALTYFCATSKLFYIKEVLYFEQGRIHYSTAFIIMYKSFIFTFTVQIYFVIISTMQAVSSYRYNLLYVFSVTIIIQIFLLTLNSADVSLL